jgi:hypothetical protein
LGEREAPARVLVEPRLDGLGLVRGGVVEHGDDPLAGGDLGLERIQKAMRPAAHPVHGEEAAGGRAPAQVATSKNESGSWPPYQTMAFSMW